MSFSKLNRLLLFCTMHNAYSSHTYATMTKETKTYLYVHILHSVCHGFIIMNSKLQIHIHHKNNLACFFF
jgi:hypothetical protein